MITQRISLAPPAPLATDVGTPAFDEKAFPLIQFWGTNADELNTFADQMNALSDEMNADKVATESYKNTAVLKAGEAQSSALASKTEADRAKSESDKALAAKTAIEGYVVPDGTTFTPEVINAKVRMSQILNITNSI